MEEHDPANVDPATDNRAWKAGEPLRDNGFVRFGTYGRLVTSSAAGTRVPV